MKFTAFILAFLVLVLGIMPCADANAMPKLKAKTEVSKSSHRQSDQQQDHCSPFCHCTCCAGFSINHFIAFIKILPQYKDKTKATYLTAYVAEVTIPIWQPPKLSANIIS